MLSNFAMFLLEDKTDNVEDYAPNTLLHFSPDFNNVLCNNEIFQIIQEIKDNNVINTYSWYSDLYKQLKIHTYVATIYKGVTIVKETIGVGHKIILKN